MTPEEQRDLIAEAVDLLLKLGAHEKMVWTDISQPDAPRCTFYSGVFNDWHLVVGRFVRDAAHPDRPGDSAYQGTARREVTVLALPPDVSEKLFKLAAACVAR